MELITTVQYQGIRAVPPGGRFTFQKPDQGAWIQASHALAAEGGVLNFGIGGVRLLGIPAFLIHRWASNFCKYFYPNFDVIYIVKPDDDGVIIIAQGNADFLSTLYRDLPFALQAYCRRVVIMRSRLSQQQMTRHITQITRCCAPLRTITHHPSSSRTISQQIILPLLL
jgi:hypothetical protein